MTRQLLLKIGAGLFGLALAILAAIYLLTSASRARKDAAVATATAVTADASKEAAQDTVHIVVDNQAAHGRIDVVTTENQREILAAPGASAPADAGVHNTGLRALCLRDTYRDEPACKRLLDTSPEGAARPNAGSPAP